MSEESPQFNDDGFFAISNHAARATLYARQLEEEAEARVGDVELHESAEVGEARASYGRWTRIARERSLKLLAARDRFDEAVEEEGKAKNALDAALLAQRRRRLGPVVAAAAEAAEVAIAKVSRERAEAMVASAEPFVGPHTERYMAAHEQVYANMTSDDLFVLFAGMDGSTDTLSRRLGEMGIPGPSIAYLIGEMKRDWDDSVQPATRPSTSTTSQQ